MQQRSSLNGYFESVTNTFVRKRLIALNEGGRPDHISMQDDRQLAG